MSLPVFLQLHGPDLIGLLAGMLTILTFAQRAPIPMRCTAICANTCFLTYAHLDSIMPILVLHGILLPVNLLRLSEALSLRWNVLKRQSTHHETVTPPCGLFSIF